MCMQHVNPRCAAMWSSSLFVVHVWALHSNPLSGTLSWHCCPADPPGTNLLRCIRHVAKPANRAATAATPLQRLSAAALA
jgi:hypothetical protein